MKFFGFCILLSQSVAFLATLPESGISSPYVSGKWKWKEWSASWGLDKANGWERWLAQFCALGSTMTLLWSIIVLSNRTGIREYISTKRENIVRRQRKSWSVIGFLCSCFGICRRCFISANIVLRLSGVFLFISMCFLIMILFAFSGPMFFARCCCYPNSCVERQALNTTYCDLATAGGTGDVKTTRRNAAILGVFRSLSKTSELCGTRFVFILLYYAGIIAMIVNCAFGMALSVYMIHWVRKNDQLVLLAASKNLRVSHQDGINDDDDDDDDDEYISDDEEDSQTNSDESDFRDEDSDYEEKEVQERRAKRTRGKKSSSSASIESVHLLSSNIDDNDFDRHDHATIKIRNNRKHFRKGMKIRAKKVNWNKPHTGQVVKYDKRTNSYLIEFGYGEQQMIPDECILGSVEEEEERRSGTNHRGSRESHSSRHRNSTDSGNSDTKTTLRFQDPEEYQHKRGSQTARQFSGSRGISSSFNNHDNSFEFENNGNDFQRSDGGDIEMEKLESNPFISGRYTARQNNQTSM